MKRSPQQALTALSKFKLLSPLAVLLGLLMQANLCQADVSADDLHQAVLAHLQTENNSPNPDIRVEYRVGAIDSRMRLADCNVPLKIRRHGQRAGQNRLLFKVSCPSPSPWQLYIPVTREQYLPVAIASHPLHQNQILTEQDVELRELDVSQLNNGYFSDLSLVIGRKLRRPIATGAPLKPNTLIQRQLISKGDEVFIRAENGVVSIQVPAIALSNGKMGQQISVRNKQSRRVIKARVTGPGQVEVVL